MVRFARQGRRRWLGVDIGKAALDVAIFSSAQRWRFSNDDAGRSTLVALLREHGVRRVGLEASGGYERPAVETLRDAEFEVIVFQPRQVRAYAIYRLRRAKTDRIDAGLIAACAADHGPARAAPDPRLAALAEPLRWLEQIDIARLKTRREAYRDEAILAQLDEEIARLKALRVRQIKLLRSALSRCADMARRIEIIASVPGVGERTALTLLIAMPELGSLSREEAASWPGSRHSTTVPANTMGEETLLADAPMYEPLSTLPLCLPHSDGTKSWSPSTKGSKPQEKAMNKRSSPALESC